MVNTAFRLPNQGTWPEHTASCVAHPTALLTVALGQRAQLWLSPSAEQNQGPFLAREFRAQACLILSWNTWGPALSVTAAQFPVVVGTGVVRWLESHVSATLPAVCGRSEALGSAAVVRGPGWRALPLRFPLVHLPYGFLLRHLEMHRWVAVSGLLLC